ncbi:hypothetical protein E1289_30235, partial [Actinomadura sp. 6K520]
MTATGKPDDDHAVERPEPGQPAQAPPPPQWLDDRQPSATPLLPGDDTDQDDPEATASDTDRPAVGAPEDDDEAEMVDRTVSDRTVSDFDLDESSRTVVVPGRSPAASTDDLRTEESQEDAAGERREEMGQPAPPPPPMATSTDIPAPPPFPYGQEVSGAAQAQPPAPPPFPYGQEIPDATR